MGLVDHRRGSDSFGEQSTELEKLVQCHYAAVYNLAYRVLGRREDAEDVAQQTFVRALPHLTQLRVQDAAGQWLYRITANLCVDELRRRQRNEAATEAHEAALDELADPDPLQKPPVAAELHETRLSVWRATLTLPARQRLVLALREWHQMSYADIAAAMGTTSVATVESLLFRARQGFRLAYTQQTLPVPRGGVCEWVMEHLSASIDQELGYREQKRIDAHLPDCETCQFASRELRATSRLFGLIPLIAPPPAAQAAALLAASSAGAAGSVVSAVGAAGGLSLGIGTVKIWGGMAAMVAAVTVGAVWTADAPAVASGAVLGATEVRLVTPTMAAPTPSDVLAPTTAAPRAQADMTNPTPTTASSALPPVVNGQQLRGLVATPVTASPLSSTLAASRGSVSRADVPTTQAISGEPTRARAAPRATGSPPTPSRSDEPTVAAAHGQEVHNKSTVPTPAPTAHHPLNDAHAAQPDGHPPKSAVDSPHGIATGRTSDRGSSADPPSNRTSPTAQNAPEGRRAGQPAGAEPANDQHARDSGRGAPQQADHSRANPSPATENSAVPKSATGAGGPKSPELHPSPAPPPPAPPKPAQPRPAPSAAIPPRTPPSAAPQSAPDHTSARETHPEKVIDPSRR